MRSLFEVTLMRCFSVTEGSLTPKWSCFTISSITQPRPYPSHMLYFIHLMKRLARPAAIITISLLIALFSAAITYPAKISGSSYSTTAAYFLQPTTSQEVEEDQSVVGSTDGIAAMGAVIVLIILIPIMIHRRSWMHVD